jgi:hypothetical protein
VPYSVQCYLPRRAFDALDMPAIITVAKMAGVERPRVESSTHKIPDYVPAGSVRVTCSLEMAACLVEAFTQQTERAEKKHEGALVVDSALAAKALLDGMEEANR